VGYVVRAAANLAHKMLAQFFMKPRTSFAATLLSQEAVKSNRACKALLPICSL